MELLLETHFDNGVTHFQKGIHCFAVFKSQRPVISFTINKTFAHYRNDIESNDTKITLIIHVTQRLFPIQAYLYSQK